MKKLFATILAIASALLAALSLAACGDGFDAEHTISVGASATPHAEILNAVRDDLYEQGYKFEVKVFDDYITPNLALEEGEIDANYFQHTPYLNTFNIEHGTHLSSAGKIHYEPFGVYGKGVDKDDYSSIKTGRTILIPNDGSNLARALYLLQDEGFLTLKSTSFSESLTIEDIADSKGNSVKAAEAQTVPQLLQEAKAGTLAVVNGNYALQAGLRSEDALAFEDASDDAAQLYANIIAVKTGNEALPKIKALLAALCTQKVATFITETFGGAVLPVFSVE